MKNLTLKAIASVCRGVYRGDETLLSREVTDVVIDSRKVTKGCLFVAISGERFNAHEFIPEAADRGALCAVSQEDLGLTPFPYILVGSTGQALLDVAGFYRASFDIKVVGITGSVGKTSTKEMLVSVLSKRYKVHKTLGNFNNECGLPLSIFGIRGDDEISVLEMGVNHFGEMRRLSAAASPNICLITNIGTAHLEFLKTKEGILKEKSQMLRDMREGGRVILNGDDPLLCSLKPLNGEKPLFYGMGAHCQIRGEELSPLGLEGTACTIRLPEASFRCVVPLPGPHMVLNALAGAAAGFILGLTPEEIKAGIEHSASLPGRNHLIKREGLLILDDCYNANPTSVKAALETLSSAFGRKVAILGNMGELGEGARKLHYDVGVYAARQGIDLVCAVGALAREIARGTADASSPARSLWFPDKAKLLEEMKGFLQEGDNILVKASNGEEFPEIVEALRDFVF